MPNYVSLYTGHDASITFYNSDFGVVHVIELERLLRKRYYRLHFDNDDKTIEMILTKCKSIATKFWQFDRCDKLIMDKYAYVNPGLKNTIMKVFQCTDVRSIANHHMQHAACTFFQSDFEKAIVYSYDGGGDDEWFNVYAASKEPGNEGITRLENIPSDFGGGYALCGSAVKEVAENSRHLLALAGKLMGLCAYGTADEEKARHFAEFFYDKNYDKLSKSIGINLKNSKKQWDNPLDNWCLEGQDAYDFAATAQLGYEIAFFKVFEKYNNDPRFKNWPVCMTGGGSLNVLVNEKIKNKYGNEIFVPPCPSDCGLSYGHLAIALLQDGLDIPKNITYTGLPILDIDNLGKVIGERNATKTNNAEIAKLLKEGNIIGMVHGDSEVGPRALGNRSIVCDPSFPNMKDILNSKVKFREWFRPFAPFCKKEDAPEYFVSKNFDGIEFMSFAPLVKEEFRTKLPSVTHADGSARLQTVTSESHQGFYDLLTEFGKISNTRVLLNTSFNIRGRPILSTISDALHVLDNTDMDYVVIENYLFAKEK